MKKTIRIIISITILVLAGCSSVKTSVDNMNKPNTNKNTSLSSNQQSQAGDTNTKLLESIDTKKSQFEKGYYDYKGTINTNIPIQMSIYPLEKDIVGTYYYDKNENELKLKGKAGEKNIILYEYDETGKNTGIFQGTMSTVDKIEGTWISADNKISYPFILSLEDIISGVEYGKRYDKVVNNKSDQDVENFVSKIKSDILNSNKIQLAEEINYPISVKINKKIIKIENKDDLIKNYDQIFHVNYKQEISKAPTKHLFVNNQGIMFADGNIWINDVKVTSNTSKLLITFINN